FPGGSKFRGSGRVSRENSPGTQHIQVPKGQFSPLFNQKHPKIAIFTPHPVKTPRKLTISF
ncbi:MAG: hypothetical protein LC123_07935, partial [Burkholderiales bacterium]|nr:hypothetical protein [Burkholderiales bacterium]